MSVETYPQPPKALLHGWGLETRDTLFRLPVSRGYRPLKIWVTIRSEINFSTKNQMVGLRTVIQLCADTGSDTKPFKDAGFNVILVGRNIGVENYHPPKDVWGVIANPVCTEFSIARDGKARDPEKGLFLVRECQRIIAECNPHFWVIENPATGRLKDYLGEPTMTYEPWHYGSPWTKKTALWGKFNKPERVYQKWEDVPKLPLYTRPGRTKPSLAFLHKSAFSLIPEFAGLPVPESDMEFRSLASQKFAQAFYQVNKD